MGRARHGRVYVLPRALLHYRDITKRARQDRGRTASVYDGLPQISPRHMPVPVAGQMEVPEREAVFSRRMTRRDGGKSGSYSRELDVTQRREVAGFFGDIKVAEGVIKKRAAQECCKQRNKGRKQFRPDSPDERLQGDRQSPAASLCVRQPFASSLPISFSY